VPALKAMLQFSYIIFLSEQEGTDPFLDSSLSAVGKNELIPLMKVPIEKRKIKSKASAPQFNGIAESNEDGLVGKSASAPTTRKRLTLNEVPMALPVLSETADSY
jgi:hypothetical protein